MFKRLNTIFATLLLVSAAVGCSGNHDPLADDMVLVETESGSFRICRYEVTQKLWKEVMGDNPSEMQGDDLPVEQVNWDQCQAFIARLNELTGKSYRLPTAAEWEFACRGGKLSKGYAYSGSDDIDAVAWYDGNSEGKTHPVGQKQPNELGLYDMSGNVWEWCQDMHDDIGMCRGGSWIHNARNCDPSLSNETPRGFWINSLGLRLAESCEQSPDDSEFIRDMYEKVLYEEYGFLENHCSKGLLNKLSAAYDYDGEGYAVWQFRSGAQDGPSKEHSVIHIEDEGDGWYTYTATDMGITFRKKIRISHKDGQTMIEDVIDEYRLISPLPSGLDVKNLKDCTVPAKFTSDDFRWMGGNLRMTVYSKDLYDAVDISQMQAGDTLIYMGNPMVVETIEEVNGGLAVNGDIDNGGCCLVGYEGGTYVARNWDDHATYTELGIAELALADDFVIIDCGDFPTDPIDTIRTGQKLYLETLRNSHRDFFPLSTLVTIENGMITEINRRWIP